MKNEIALYNKYFVDNNFERLGLFELLRDMYSIKSAIYLGSFVHITPAFVFPKTAFIDSDRRVQKFFDSPKVLSHVIKNKQYDENPEIFSSQQNYEEPINTATKYDLLISQYAGFVSQSGKKYLKNYGLLLVNSSHGDAAMAYLDDDYEFIGALNQSNGKWSISNKNLEEYFIPKKGNHPTKKEIESSMKGVDYTKSPTNYLFKKIK